MKRRRSFIPTYYVWRGLCLLLAFLFAASAAVTGTLAWQNTPQAIGQVESLIIEKVVENMDGSPLTEAQLEQAFSLTVTLENFRRAQVGVLLGGEAQTLPVQNGSFALSLRHGEEAVLFDLPVRTSYSIQTGDYSEYGFVNLTRTVTGLVTVEPVELALMALYGVSPFYQEIGGGDD